MDQLYYITAEVNGALVSVECARFDGDRVESISYGNESWYDYRRAAIIKRFLNRQDIRACVRIVR